MKNLHKTLEKAVLISVLAFVCWVGITTIGFAQSKGLRLESRLDRVESELSRVRSNLMRLEAQISGPTPIAVPSADSSAPLNDLSLNEQFDNLATLAIELKQDLQQLEDRVVEIEQRLNP